MEDDSGGNGPGDRPYKRQKTARDYEREARRPDKQTRQKIKAARQGARLRAPTTPRLPDHLGSSVFRSRYLATPGTAGPSAKKVSRSGPRVAHSGATDPN